MPRAPLPSPFLVGSEPLPLGRPLDERDRGRTAADQLGLGETTARRVGGAADLFERNEVACAQIWWHQHYLASFRSRGSSANNHVIAEAAGLLVAALAFDLFAESPRWAEEAARVLEQELKSNTFPSGVNREMAFDYHGFVAELAVVAAAEASWADRPSVRRSLGPAYGMFDVVAATVDVKVRAPRYGDGDNGRALVLDPPAAERWSGLLAIGEALFDPPRLVARGWSRR